jgi:hypothetical protein
MTLKLLSIRGLKRTGSITDIDLMEIQFIKMVEEAKYSTLLELRIPTDLKANTNYWGNYFITYNIKTFYPVYKK